MAGGKSTMGRGTARHESGEPVRRGRERNPGVRGLPRRRLGAPTTL